MNLLEDPFRIWSKQEELLRRGFGRKRPRSQALRTWDRCENHRECLRRTCCTTQPFLSGKELRVDSSIGLRADL